MTDTGNTRDLAALEPLEPLEPLDDGGAARGAGGAAPAEASLAMLRASLPAPGFNPFCSDKTYYRFLFAGVLMLVGCVMPFSADYQQVGYKTMSGAIYLVIGIGMVWTWWGAIHNNRSTSASLKWLVMCLIPLAAVIMGLVSYDPEAALAAAKSDGLLKAEAQVSTWKTLTTDLFTAGRPSSEAPAAALRAGNFWRLFGPGKVFVLLGALIAILGFFGGIVGGAKQNKQEKKVRQSAASERKRK